MLLVRAVSACVATTSPSCQVSRPGSLLFSMDLRDCYSPATPRSLVHLDRSSTGPGPTWRSSKSKGGVPASVPGRRVRVPEVVPHAPHYIMRLREGLSRSGLSVNPGALAQSRYQLQRYCRSIPVG